MNISVNGEDVTFEYGNHARINFKYPNMLNLFKKIFDLVMDEKMINEVVILNSKATKEGKIVENYLHFLYNPKMYDDFTIVYVIESDNIKMYEVGMDWYTIELMCAMGDLLGYDRDDYV